MKSATLVPTVKMLGTNMTFSYTLGIKMKDCITLGKILIETLGYILLRIV
jgi:hypothetical protein